MLVVEFLREEDSGPDNGRHNRDPLDDELLISVSGTSSPPGRFANDG